MALGYKVAIYPVTLLFAAAEGMRYHLESGSVNEPFPRWPDPAAFARLKEILGFREFSEREERYRTPD